MPGHDIVVVGFSAGGIDPLLRMVSRLPGDLPASLFVVHHFPPHGITLLPAILSRACRLPASAPSDNDPIEPAHIYVAPPDRHLIVGRGVMRLVLGPLEHSNRPAVDPLFRSAADSYGARVIGVVLSGTLNDGTDGLRAIKAAGGLALVQDPATCSYSGMPSSAIEHVAVDEVAHPDTLCDALVRMVGQRAETPRAIPRRAGRVPAVGRGHVEH